MYSGLSLISICWARREGFGVYVRRSFHPSFL
jgi:hypothetical protein